MSKPPPAEQTVPAQPAREAAHRFRPLDGLRGLAVVAVVLFHLGIDAFPGGLLGVDVFFVLSGFLITGLLLGEWRETGRLSLRRFWIRRWRRLLPALLLVLVVVAVLAQWLSDPAQVEGIRDEAVATLLYVANWRALFSGSSYFDVVAVSPLRHTWSLGVEEQFYVVWPLLAIFALSRRRSPRLLLGIAAGGATLSAGLMLGLALAGVGVDRLYFGTDTRAQALLIGCALAGLLFRCGIGLPGAGTSGAVTSGAGTPSATAVPSACARRLAVGAGFLGLVVLLGFVLRVDGESAWLYRGGFTLVAAATALVLVSVTVAPNGLPARLLAFRPLAYLGRISYGLYLWHWPVVVFLTPDRVGLGGLGLAALRTAVMLAVSVASFHLVEQPVRRHGLRLPTGLTVRVWPARIPLARSLVPLGVIALAVALLVVPVPGRTSALAAFQQAVPPPPPAPAEATEPTPSPSAGPRRVLAPAVTRKGPTRVMLVGDSVAQSLGKGVDPAVDPATVTFTNQGFLGCGVTIGKPRGWDQPEACLAWPQRWQSLVDQFRPDVTLLLPSVWDTFDRQRDGRWQRLGEPDFDAYVTSEFETAVRILTSRGGRVAALTPPCNDADLANAIGPNRLPPQNAQRYAMLEALLEGVLQRYPGVTMTLPFGELVCPGGKFERKRDGQVLRSSDGIHLEPYAGTLFARTLMPEVVRWVRTPAYASS